MVFRANYIFTVCGSRIGETVEHTLSHSRSRGKEGEGGREVKKVPPESARNADAQLELQGDF